jgi:hypothetical protein
MNKDQVLAYSRAKTGIQQPGRCQQMIRQSLRKFVARVLRAKRITYGDVRQLQREILVDGLSNRDEAEALIALDHAVAKTDPAWSGYLVTLVVDFAVWGSRPTGYVDEETARWLAAWLSSATPSKTLLRIGREVISEAQDVGAALRSFVETAPAIPVPAARRGASHLHVVS